MRWGGRAELRAQQLSTATAKLIIYPEFIEGDLNRISFPLVHDFCFNLKYEAF